MKRDNQLKMPIWRSKTGEKVACIEKIKVMQQNLEELAQMAQDTFEDGVLMGVTEEQLRNFMLSIINNLNNPYKN
jgi:hypothetical protein